MFDLEPIRLCYLNDVLALDAEQARRNSPLHLPPGAPCPVTVVVGELETAAFHDQSRAFAAKLQAAGWTTSSQGQPAVDHFAIVMSMAGPGPPIVQTICRQMGLAGQPA